MVLTCLGTGSSGNCYLLNSESGTLIIDAGISIRKIKAGLDWNISKVSGALITHAHKDHSMAMAKLERMGIPVYAPFRGDKDIALKGSATVKAFPLRAKDGRWMHTNSDGTECPNYGFLIETGGKRVLYVTDFLAIPYTFKTWGINAMLISCNHDDDVEYENSAKEYHSVLGHSSLSTVKEFVRVNATDSLENIILCHMSDSADEGRMLTEVSMVAPLFTNVYSAHRGCNFLL